MDVTMGPKAIKAFATAIQALSKIGKDLFIEADSEQVVLRALNDSKSAFSAVYLGAEVFFDDFACGRDDGSPFTCKLLLRAVLGVLKSIRRVQSLKIHYDDGRDEGDGPGVEPHLCFELHNEAGIEKRHHFHIQDCEIIQAVFHREGANKLTAPAKQLGDLLDHMHGSYEVALYAEADHVRVKTFRSDDPMGIGAAGDAPGTATLSTEMGISATDFDEYELAEDEEVGLVFSVREVRSFLTFCDSTCGSGVSVHFHAGGRPILFTAEDSCMRVELVLATIEPVDSEPPLTQSRRSASRRSGSQAARAEDEGASQRHEDMDQHFEDGPPPSQEDFGHEAPYYSGPQEGEERAEGRAEVNQEPDRGLSQASTTKNPLGWRPSQGTEISLNSTVGAQRLMSLREANGRGMEAAHMAPSQATTMSISSTTAAQRLVALQDRGRRGAAEHEEMPE